MGAASRKRKEARKKIWYKQALVTTQIPNPFSPPQPPPFTTHTEFGDADKIMGYHIPAQNNLDNQMFQGDRGRFECDRDAPLQLNDVLRSDELGVYIRLITEPLKSQDFNVVQLARWGYQVISRTEAELDAAQIAGG